MATEAQRHGEKETRKGLSTLVGMRLIVLSKEVFAVIVAVWRAHDAMNVLMRGQIAVWLWHELCQVCRPLVVEFDENYRTLNAVVKHAVVLGATDPRKPRVLDVLLHLTHFYTRVPVVHVAYVQLHQVAQLAARWIFQILGTNAGIIEHHVVLESFR